MRGRFITVEGGEGVGKSCFSDGLARELSAANLPLVRTFEPGGTPTAVKLREVFLSPPPDDPLLIETEFCIVSAARAQHVGRKIRPALAEGKWVLCDRFADSSRVYQGMAAGIPEKSLEELISLTTFGISPDVTFLLDCDVETSMARLGKRATQTISGKAAEETRFDKSGKVFHENIRQYFLTLQKRFPQRIFLLDAGGSPQKSVAQAMDVIRQRFL